MKKNVSLKPKITGKIKNSVRKMSDFKPKDEKDYYSFGRMLISRRFAIFIIIVMGLLIFFYYAKVSNIRLFGGNGGVRVYDYDSIALRFISGNVKIRSKQGDIAYMGKVSDGMANGQGRLFYPDGTVMYEGDFKDNNYDGTGNLYYSDGILMYKGGFKAGKYDGHGDLYYPTEMINYDGEFYNGAANGEGTLYRENGSRMYSGEFRDGLADGQVSFYDGSDNLIYSGSYIKGRVVYSEILGDDSDEIAKHHTGNKKIYYNDDFFMVYMEGIDAYYAGKTVGSTLSNSVVADSIYVIQDECVVGGTVCYTIEDVINVLGFPDYEGNTSLNILEAVCVSENDKLADMLDCQVYVTWESYNNDVHYVLSLFEEDDMSGVYIYMFEDESSGIQYTFYCKDKNGDFGMYLMQNCRE